MSDKLLHNRLDSLFADLDEIGDLPSPDGAGDLSRWTFSCDADGQYTNCSEEVSEVLGIPPDDMLGKPLARYALTADSADQLESTLKNGSGPFEVRVNFRTSDGEMVPALVQIEQAPSPNGAVAGWEGSVQVLDQEEAAEIASQTAQALEAPGEDLPSAEPALVEPPADLVIPETKPLLPAELEQIQTAQEETPAAEQPTVGTAQESAPVEPAETEATAQSPDEPATDQPDLETVQDYPPEALESRFDTLLEDEEVEPAVETEIQEVSETPAAVSDPLPEVIDERDIPEEAFHSTFSPLLDEEDLVDTPAPDDSLPSLEIEFDQADRETVDHIELAAEATSDTPAESLQSGVFDLEAEAPASVDGKVFEALDAEAAIDEEYAEPEAYTRDSYFLDPEVLEREPAVDQVDPPMVADPPETADTLARESEPVFETTAELEKEVDPVEEVDRVDPDAVSDQLETTADIEEPASEAEGPRISTGPLPPIEADGPIESQEPIDLSAPPEEPITRLEPVPRGTGILRLSEATAQSATQETPAILTVPVHLQDNPIGQLEIVDETPNRVWTEDDRRLVEEIADQLSLALENAQLFAQTQKALDLTETQAKRLALLNNMSEMLNRCSNLEEVFTIAAPKTSEILPSDWVSLALLSDTRQEFTVVAHHGMEMDLQVGQSEPLAGSNLEAAIRERRIVINTTSKASDLEDFETYMVAPLIASGNIIGTLSIGRSEALFEPRDENLLLQIASLLASTIEGRRLFEQTESALSETEALFRASAELNAVESFTDILGILQKYSVIGDRARHATIFLFDRPWQWGGVPDWQMRVAYWSEQSSQEPASRLPLNGWSAAPILLDQENTTIVPSISEDPYLARDDSPLKPELGEAQSALMVPLTVGQQWIGYVLGSYGSQRKFSEPQIRRLSSLAGQAAVAIENLRLLEETRSRARQLQTAAEIARDASETLAVEELLNRSVRLIADRFGFYHTSIYLLDENSNTAINWASAGSAEVIAARGTQRVEVGSRSVIGYVTQTGPLVINDVRQSPIHEPDPNLPETRAELGIPMKIGDRVIGALDVQSVEENPFSPDDVAVLQTLTDQIAVAVDNARSYELAQEAFQEARQRLQELSMLYNVSQSFAGAPLEIEEIANLIARQFVKVLGVPECAVATLDDTRETLSILVDLQVEADGEYVDLENVGRKFHIREYSGAPQVLDTFTPLVINLTDKESDPTLQAELAENGYQNRAVFPLVVKNQPIGLIDLKSRTTGRLTSEGSINLASTLANQAAIALENARLYQDQFRAVEQLREVDILKSQFLANMSHELRTPLNSIIGFSRVILKGIDGPVTKLQEQDLTAIYNAGQHLLGLINDILDLSKIEAGKMELSYEEVDITELINSVMSTAIGLVKHKPIQLKKDIPEELPLAYGDPLRIRQVLLNLLSNAAKFTEEGTITVEAVTAIRPNREGRLVIVRVTDTGPGISEADQAKLFQPFSQVDASPTRKSGGSGLGLSISRHLIEMHNGTIEVESELGKGSTFYFSLLAVEPGQEPPPVPQSSNEVEPAIDRNPPSRAPQLAPEQMESSVEKVEVKAPRAPVVEATVEMPMEVAIPELPKTGELTGSFILAIDKDEQIIKMYDRYLQPHGYQVLPATTAETALEAAERLQPALITLDVMAPTYDGWELLKSLRENAYTAAIPVVICSIIEERERAAALGATDYLVKPILEADLVEVVTRLESEPGPGETAGEIEPKQILIVDQDPADIRVLRMLLEEDGQFKIGEAEDGRRTLETLIANPPDALILTSGLPDMDAFTFIKTVRANPSLRTIPIILMVEKDLAPEIEQQLARNCEAVFHKTKLNQEKLLESLVAATS